MFDEDMYRLAKINPAGFGIIKDFKSELIVNHLGFCHFNEVRLEEFVITAFFQQIPNADGYNCGGVLW